MTLRARARAWWAVLEAKRARRCQAAALEALSRGLAGAPGRRLLARAAAAESALVRRLERALEDRGQ